ncbi:helix-turn-helix domain-containing protein [Arthrobacter sp. lap29]|uniref:helix-turn-helix domain-containing protein n=1 Tax=Arthrobacter sp. lap29 TaxID=3056122 RepID=UPI0028F7089E|nr:helix-turn-helix domain-containing protein [Arthrobacter sp. lap29]
MEPSILMNLTRSRILHMLVTYGPAPAPDISNALSLTKDVVNRELEQLTRAGFVRASEAIPSNFNSIYTSDAPQILEEMAQVRYLLGLEI